MNTTTENKQLEIKSNGSDPELELSTEERIKNLADKLRPRLKMLWDNRKRFFVFNFAVLVITILYLLFLAKPYFISSVTILPEYGSKSSTLSGLSDLAAMAGVSVGEGAPTEIYQNLIMSEAVLEPVIYSKYKTEEFIDSVNLIQYFEIEPDESLPAAQQKREQFLELLEDLTKDKISTDVERVTKILTYKVELPESKLSADVANRIAESLDEYIRTERRSFASEQRFYLEKRINQIKDSLTLCENQLKIFTQQNRIVTQSPNLILEQSRLMRNIEIMQTILVEVTKQLEIVKIDEIKNTPVVNVRELAKEPVIKEGPKRTLILIFIMFFSAIFNATYMIFKNDLKKYYSVLKDEGADIANNEKK